MNDTRYLSKKFTFDNSYARLPERFYERLSPTKVPVPKLIKLNEELALELGLDPEVLKTPGGVEILSGNCIPDGAEPLAMAVEVFVLGKEATGTNYVLVSRETKSFVPCRENERKCRTPGETVHLFTDWVSGKPHGVKYYGYLITITDKNGVVVQAKASNNWILQHLDNIMKAQDGWYLDGSLARTYPSGIFWKFDRDEEQAATRDEPNE